MIRDLGELGSSEAEPFLADARNDANRYVGEAAREGLWKISRLTSGDATSSLAETLKTDPDPAHRAWAAFKLGERRDSRGTDGLLTSLADPEDMV